MSTPKEIKRVIKYALDNGFELLKTTGGHFKLKKNGVRISVSGTPGCWHAAKNARKDIDAVLAKEHHA